MNDLKVNFKASAYYLNALKQIMERSLKRLAVIKELESREDKDFIQYLVFEEFMVVIPALEIFEFMKNSFTPEEEDLLKWVKKMTANYIVDKDPSQLEENPSVAHHYFSFTHKRIDTSEKKE